MSEIVSVEELEEAYLETGSCYTVGRRFGIRGGSVHERLQRHRPGLVKPNKRVWTPKNLEILLREYETHAANGTLNVLAKKLCTLKTSVCSKAGELGLTNPVRPKRYLSVWRYMPEEDAAAVWTEFKGSSLGLIAWCKRKGYDDLGFSRTMKQFFGDEWESVMESKQPRTSLYRRGRQFEYSVRDQLRKVGFWAQRSPASKTPIDILAIRPGEVWMVQCKRHGALGVVEWNKLMDVATTAGARPILAMLGAKRGLIEYFILIEKKDGSKRSQPMSQVFPCQ